MSKKKKIKNNQTPIEGIVQGHRDGHGFLLREDGGDDLYIPAHEMQAILHNDRVKAVIAGFDYQGRPEGKILEIVERPKKTIIGRLVKENGVWLVAPEDHHYTQDILIPESALGDAKKGQIVTIELTEEPTLHSQPLGRVIEVLGNIDDSGIEIEIAVRKFEIPHIFAPAVLDEAKKLPTKVRATDKRGRVDLTDVPFVTIDGEDARDFDDAVYCEPITMGRQQANRLIVAIADVSHYVRPNEAIDQSAYERATSVYFPRRVIPMLPEKLSNGICSLNPNEERLCMVCDMVIDQQGITQAYQFYPAVIRSHARLTYTEVHTILMNPKGSEAKTREALLPHLISLYQTYKTLIQARAKRGALDFDSVETKIIWNEQGRIERIEPMVRNEAHRIIEEAMLAANVSAAHFIESAKRMALYRVHEGPTEEKTIALQSYLKAIGLPARLSERPSPKELQQVALLAKGRPDEQHINMMLLRSMHQAVYTPENKGHFGLAYEQYAHFTSPIRRYPDLLVHRVIRGILSKRKYQLDDRTAWSNLAKAHAAQSTEKKPKTHHEKELQIWAVAGTHCSANERRADEASHDVMAWLKCTYMSQFIGEVFEGTVSSVTRFGLFVELKNMYVEGLIHISAIGRDYYQYDEIRQELVGERTGERFSIGTPITVQVSRVDLDSRQIDFMPVMNNGDTQKRGKRGSSGSKLDIEIEKATKRALKKVKKAPAKKRG